MVVVGSWIAGYLRWQRRQAVQARADATLQALESRRLHDLYEQEQERSRIAADMHDLVAHSWAVVAAQADGARYVVREDPDRAQQALTVIGDTARSAMDDVRVLLGRLREQPPAEQALVFEQPDALVARMRDAGHGPAPRPQRRAGAHGSAGRHQARGADRVADQRPQARRPRPAGRGRRGLERGVPATGEQRRDTSGTGPARATACSGWPSGSPSSAGP